MSIDERTVRQVIRDTREWDTFFKVIDTSGEVCGMRARQEKDEEILPIIERMAEQYEPLSDDERLWPE